MKRTLLALAFAGAAAAANSADERAAVAVVKKYSQAIACQVDDTRETPNQYRVVTLDQGGKDVGGLGSLHVVHWQGDVGCLGGNGTVLPNFTIVEHSGFRSASPVVMTDYKFPTLELVLLTNLAVKNGALVIQGVAYGPDDGQHRPQKRVTYTLKLDRDKRQFVKQ